MLKVIILSPNGLLIVLKNNYGNIAKVKGLNDQVAPVMVHVSKHIT